MRRAGIALLENARDFFQFGHQTRSCSDRRPAVSIRRMSAFSFCAFSSASKARPAASPPGLARDKVGAGAAWPRPPAARSRRRGRYRPPPARRLALAGQAARQLADGGGLAGAVDAGHQDHERPFGAVDGQRLLHRLERGGDFPGQDGAHLGIGDFAVIAVPGHGGGQAPGFGHAHIGADQRFLQPGHGLGVELLLGEKSGQAAGQAGAGFGQAFFQPREQAGFFRRRFAKISHAAACPACQAVRRPPPCP